MSNHGKKLLSSYIGPPALVGSTVLIGPPALIGCSIVEEGVLDGRQANPLAHLVQGIFFERTAGIEFFFVSERIERIYTEFGRSPV